MLMELPENGSDLPAIAGGAPTFPSGVPFVSPTVPSDDGLIGDIHAVRNPFTLAAVGDLVDARR